MKKIWESYKKCGKKKKLEIQISVGLIVVSAFVVVLNFIGFINVSNSVLLSIVILLLCSSYGVNILQEIDTLSGLTGNIRDISSKVKAVNEKLENAKSTKDVVLPRRVIDDKTNLNDVWKEATEIYLLAIANTSFLRGNGIVRIKEATERGTKIKIVSLNPQSDLVKSYEKSNIVSETSLPLDGNIVAYKKQCKKNTKFRNNVELKVTDYLLPYSMMIVKKDREVIFLKVDLYGVDIDYMRRRSFVVPSDDYENIDFYLKQWEKIGENKDMTKLLNVN